MHHSAIDKIYFLAIFQIQNLVNLEYVMCVVSCPKILRKKSFILSICLLGFLGSACNSKENAAESTYKADEKSLYLERSGESMDSYPVFFLTSEDAEKYHARSKRIQMAMSFGRQAKLTPVSEQDRVIFDRKLEAMKASEEDFWNSFTEDLPIGASIYYYEYDGEDGDKAGYMALLNGEVIKDDYAEYFSY